jgi:predicted dehydrogenase
MTVKTVSPFDRIRIGLIGYGVGKLYAAAAQSVNLYYSGFPPVELASVATATEMSASKAIEQFGFERGTTDYREVIEADDINVLVIATPNHLHRAMLVDALRTDKAIYFDKPLTRDLTEAQEVLQVARETGRDAQLIFEFRFCPALQHARELIQDGRLGDIYAFRASYFRSSYVNPDKPLRWKGSFAQSGGGVLNDYMPHLIDMIIWLVGMPTRVTSQMRTFVDNRPAEKEGIERIPIDTDDHAIILNELPGGAIGTIEAGRMISGAANDMNVTICGSKGSLKWDLMDTNYLYFADNTLPASEGGWIQIPTIQRYPDAVIPGADVPPGMMRFHIASMADFLRSTLDGKTYDPGIEQGVRVQAVIEAAIHSARERIWKEIGCVMHMI